MSGIRIKYVELLRLSVEQLYYQNKVYKQTKLMPELDIQILPTNDCAEVMKRMNLVSKNTDENGGLIILASVKNNSGGPDILKYPAGKEDVLTFLMLLKNNDVVNFNNLPVKPADNSIYYFNNEVNDLTANRKKLHITKNAAGVNGINDSIKTSSENYRFHHMAAVAQGAAKVKHILTGLLIDPVSVINQSGQCDLSFNLSTLPMGKCMLLINNLPTDEFYYLERYSAQPVFGIIELSLSAAVALKYRIIEPDGSLTAERPFYLVSFIKRETFWRYIIRLQGTSPLYLEMAALPTAADKTNFINKLNIITNDTTITFSRVSNTDTEFVFISDNELFLQEKYLSSTSFTTLNSIKIFDPLNITLKKNITDPNETIVKSGLPYPLTNSINSSSLPKIYSDIFLTL